MLRSQQLADGSDVMPFEMLHTFRRCHAPLQVVQNNLSWSQRFVTFRNKLIIFRQQSVRPTLKTQVT
jgi:hypothetical protein